MEDTLTQVTERLERAYGWLDGYLGTRSWAAGEAYSMADCAASTALFYADWTYRIPERFAVVRAFRARRLAQPSYARAVDEARQFRHFFPLGAPDLD
jgi:glutathione S-transferase